MEFCGRARGVAALGGAVALLSVLFDQPLLLVGAAGVWAWLLGRQWAFATAADRTASTLAVVQSPAREQVSAGETVAATLVAEVPRPAAASVTVVASPPPGAEAPPPEERTVTLAPGANRASVTFPLTWPVAGSHEFEPTSVTVEDAAELFRTTVEQPATASVQVDTRGPDEVHVGTGGDAVAVFGEHRTGDTGPGLEPAEMREYVPGDPADSIDWKATARLGDPFVRQFEVEADRRSTLVIDRRASMAAGSPGERKLDYARQVALASLAAARDGEEPVGLVGVGEAGLTDYVPSAAGRSHYEHLARLLRGFEVVADGASGDAGPDRTRARRAATTLAGDRSRFAGRLRPYFEAADVYARRGGPNPLLEAATTGDAEGPGVTLVFTDDDGREELLETVRAGEGGDGHVVAFLTPSVLFEPGGLASLDDAYDRYVDFEQFRREIARRPTAGAYEVGPRDRLEALLAVNRQGANR
jgi:uncharacterized protein (DUF58 family)